MESQINYSSAYDAQMVTPQPDIDRVRGGIIQLELTIPRTECEGGGPAKFFPAMKLSVAIDLEQLPLVNASGYSVDRSQNTPARMSYPHGGDLDDGQPNPFTGTFAKA